MDDSQTSRKIVLIAFVDHFFKCHPTIRKVDRMFLLCRDQGFFGYFMWIVDHSSPYWYNYITLLYHKLE